MPRGSGPTRDRQLDMSPFPVSFALAKYFLLRVLNYARTYHHPTTSSFNRAPTQTIQKRSRQVSVHCVRPTRAFEPQQTQHHTATLIGPLEERAEPSLPVKQKRSILAELASPADDSWLTPQCSRSHGRSYIYQTRFRISCYGTHK